MSLVETWSHYKSNPRPIVPSFIVVFRMAVPAVTLRDVAQAKSPSQGRQTVADVGGPPEIANRLQAMGFCQGQELILIQAGDPAIVEILGTRIGMALSVAQYITLRDGSWQEGAGGDAVAGSASEHPRVGMFPPVDSVSVTAFRSP